MQGFLIFGIAVVVSTICRFFFRWCNVVLCFDENRVKTAGLDNVLQIKPLVGLLCKIKSEGKRFCSENYTSGCIRTLSIKPLGRAFLPFTYPHCTWTDNEYYNKVKYLGGGGGGGGGTRANLCWVCAASLPEPLLHYILWPIIDPILVSFG